MNRLTPACSSRVPKASCPRRKACHAIAATIREAKKCKESGEQKVILFNLSGHGLIDMTAYEQYLNGDLMNYSISDEDIKANIDKVPKII